MSKEQHDQDITERAVLNYLLTQGYSFSIIPPKIIRTLSPQQRLAYETIRGEFWEITTAFYFLGRMIGAKIGHDLTESPLAPIDKIMGEQCEFGSLYIRKRYAEKFPYSATIDRFAGTFFSVLLSPLPLLVGITYNPKTDQKPSLDELLKF